MEEEARRQMPIPFGTKWYRLENVDVKKIKGQWVFYYSGKVTPYEVGLDTYRDLRKLSMPVQYWTKDDEECQFHNSLNALVHRVRGGSTSSNVNLFWDGDLPRPGDDVLEFFRKWGPLGFYYSQASSFVYDEVSQRLDLGPAFEVERAGGINEWLSLEDYWMKHHTRKLRIGKMRTAFPEVDEVFNGYYEDWAGVHGALLWIQVGSLDWESEENIDDINGQMALTSLRPHIVQRSDKKGDKKYRLTFSFTNLQDALIGLIGENAIGAVDIRTCENPLCDKPFDSIETGRTTYCSPHCSKVGPDNKRLHDPVSKRRRMLQRRLERCPEGMVSHEESGAIKAELLAAKSEKALQEVEEEYPVILGKKK